MSVIWNVETELINSDTELRKVTATRIEDTESLSFFTKGCMKTTEEKDKVWDDIWAQYQAKRTELDKVDSVADEGKVNLEAKEVA